MVPAAHPYPEIPKVLPPPRGYRGQLIEITLVLQDDRVQVYDSVYSQLFLRRTPWGPAVCVRLREMSVL